MHVSLRCELAQAYELARWLERQHHAFVLRSQRAQRRRPQDSANSCADPCDALLCQQWRGACAQHIPLRGSPDPRDARPVRRRATRQGAARPHAPNQRPRQQARKQQAWRPSIGEGPPPPARVDGQLALPVVGRNLRYPLWDATAASCNTTMVLVTQQTSTQPRAFDELFDTVPRFDMRLHEKPQCTARCPLASTAIKCVPTAGQVYRQAAPVPGSPPVTEFRSDVPISKGCLLLPFGAFPSASCWRDDGMTIQK